MPSGARAEFGLPELDRLMDLAMSGIATLNAEQGLGEGARVGPNAVIGAGCTLGRDTFIGAGAIIRVCGHPREDHEAI